MKGTSVKLPGFGEYEAIADALAIVDFRLKIDELKVSGVREEKQERRDALHPEP